jgi:hypothetical protein
VRVLVEMRRDGDGRITGVVAPWRGSPRRTFSGWLELIHLLEVHIDDDRDEGTTT